MKIKLAVLDKNELYLNKLAVMFSSRYADKVETYLFSDKTVAMTVLEKEKINVFISSDDYDISVSDLPKRCGFAYFVSTAGIESIREQRAICKYQKVDLIYKQILSIYSENSGSITGYNLGDDSTKLCAFISAGCGCGSSTMAAACATHYAMQGKKALYLNLEKFGAADSFFSGEGQFDMSDVIFALKNKKTNLSVKLESCVRVSTRGVYFFSKSKVALDMQEINTEEIVRLISEVRLSGNYDNIVLDVDFDIDDDHLKILKQAHTIVIVGDGSEISNEKTSRALQALAVKEEKEDMPLINRMVIAYNKFSNKTCKTLGIDSIRNIGGAPRYEHASTEEIVRTLSQMDMFDKIR